MKRAVAEAIVVVLSILLAFTIDAWWDNRRERLEEQELIAGLQQEVQENRERVAQVIDTLRVAQNHLRAFAAMSVAEAATIEAAAAYPTVVRPTHRSFTYELTDGFLQATVSSGKLALIRDASLRAALAEVESLREDVQEVQDVVSDLAADGTRELSRYPEVVGVFDRPDREPLGGDVMRALRSDGAIMAIQGAKIQYWGAYASELARLEAHLAAVEALLTEARR